MTAPTIDPYGSCPTCGHWEHFNRVCGRQYMRSVAEPDICRCGAPTPWWRRILARWAR